MVLEATLICLDNSDWGRNSDYIPNRFESQTDTANIICRSKDRANRENATGVLTMAGERVEVRASPTQDWGSLMEALQGIKVHGQSDYIRGIMTAQLALKHRQNKNQRQRIVVFVASPINASSAKLEQLGRTLKKNNVSLDIVSIGDNGDNSEKIQRLFSAVNNQDTSHILECPGGSLVSEAVLSSAILREPGEAPLPGADGDMLDLEVDPNVDPDLYMALRMSLDEENRRNREAEPAKASGEGAPGEGDEKMEPSGTATGSASATGSAVATEGASSEKKFTTPPQLVDAVNLFSSFTAAEQEIENMEHLDPDLKMALLLSLRTEQPAAANASDASHPPPSGNEADTVANDLPEASAAPPSTTTAPAAEDTAMPALDPTSFADPSFVQEIISNIPDAGKEKEGEKEEKETKDDGKNDEKGSS